MRSRTAHGPSPTAPLAMLATHQQGTVSREQLFALGFTAQMIKTMVARGLLIRIHRGVYAVGHTRLTAGGWWMAAVLACGEAARVSHLDSLALHDLRRVGSGDIHVTAARAHRIPGIRCHTTQRLGAPVVIDGIPATSLERTVLDCAPLLSHQRLRSLLEEIIRRDRFDLRRLGDELDASNGHRGVGRVRAAIAEVSATPPMLRSELERLFLEIVRAAGLPEPSVNVSVDGAVVDFHWPEQNVVVEIDSWRYHRTRRAFDDDRRRGNRLQAAGRVLLRFTDEQIRHEPQLVLAELRAALTGAAARRRGARVA